jgi:hypothetical protein
LSPPLLTRARPPGLAWPPRSCPCYYPSNAYSNQRWCCGDVRHVDLSVYAFRKLADTAHGVIGVRFRPVTCPP